MDILSLPVNGKDTYSVIIIVHALILLCYRGLVTANRVDPENSLFVSKA